MFRPRDLSPMQLRRVELLRPSGFRSTVRRRSRRRSPLELACEMVSGLSAGRICQQGGRAV